MRGQLFTMDLVVASLFALISIILILGIIGDIDVRKVQSSRWIDLGLEANTAGAQLLYGAPEPASLVGANASEISLLGISKDRGMLDGEALSALSQIGYNETKSILGIKSDMRMQVRRLDGGTLLYEYGTAPTATSNTHLFERPAMLDGEPVSVSILFWSDME